MRINQQIYSHENVIATNIMAIRVHSYWYEYEYG